MFKKTGSTLAFHTSVKAKELGFNYVLSSKVDAKMPTNKVVVYVTDDKVFFNAYGDIIEAI